jgi:uncharacterized protein (TIGR02588 family)
MKGTGRKESVHDVSVGEWIVAGISTLIVLTMIGFLVRHLIVDGKTPPDVHVHVVGEVLQASNGFVIEFEARNTGEKTAAAVDIEGALFDGTEEVERSHVTIDYVPEKGRRSGALQFRNDPRRYRLELRASGFMVP